MNTTAPGAGGASWDCPQCGRDDSWNDLGCMQCGLEFFPPSEAFWAGSTMPLADRIAQLRADWAVRSPKGLKNRRIIPLTPEQKRGIEAWARDNAGRSSYGRPRCVPAESHAMMRGYMIKFNGELAPQVLCLKCGYLASIRTWDLNPVYDACFKDNRSSNDPACARCGSNEGTEYHHWAPSAVFNDSSAWPGSYLCPSCHRAWHDAMREAFGRSLPKPRRYGAVHAHPEEMPHWLNGGIHPAAPPEAPQHNPYAGTCPANPGECRSDIGCGRCVS